MNGWFWVLFWAAAAAFVTLVGGIDIYMEARDEESRAKDKQFGYDALLPQEGPWLLGLDSFGCISYVYLGKNPQANRSPYPSVAKQFDTREEALAEAKYMVTTWTANGLVLPEGRLFIQRTQDAMTGKGDQGREFLSP